MEYTELIVKLMEQFNYKYPKVPDPTSAIAERLGMTPKTVKRRLNGETKFTAFELFDIAREFDLSLDQIYIAGNTHRHIFEMHNYGENADKFWDALQQTQDMYNSGSDSAESFFGIVTNRLPLSLWAKRDWIRSLYFYIGYHSTGRRNYPSLTEVMKDEKYKKVINGFAIAMADIKSSVYIISPQVLREMCDMIRFFYEMKTITYDEVQYLKEDISLALQAFEKLCAKKERPGTGNHLYTYISHNPVDFDFVLIESTNINVGFLFTMGLYPLANISPHTFVTIKSWYESIRNSSTLITECNENIRTEFFREQRSYLYKMLDSI